MKYLININTLSIEYKLFMLYFSTSIYIKDLMFKILYL